MGRVSLTLDIDPTRLTGVAGANYPYFIWQLQLDFPFFKADPNKEEHDIVFRAVSAQLSFTDGAKFSDARPIFLNCVFHNGQPDRANTYLNLEFPLDEQRIECIEHRRQGGAPKFHLNVQIQYEEWGLIKPTANSKVPFKWGIVWAQTTSVDEVVDVAQSQWIERVLPALGYGRVHWIEFPAVPIKSYATLDRSFKALKQAEEMHRNGFYDDAVGKCRLAVEPFFDQVLVDPTHPDSRRIPVLKTSWETKIGKATYAWLNASLGALKQASNSTHHSTNEHFGQLDSQMFLVITTAFVAYVARHFGPEDLK